MLFDSHAHLIADDDVRYPPSPLTGRLRDGDLDERFTAERMLRLMDEAGVDGACAVQRAHIYGYDNRYVVDSAQRYPDRLRAVVAIDANGANAAADIARWTDQGAVGIRFAAQSPQVADTDWFASASAMEAWAAAEKAGLSVCLHMFKPVRVRSLTDLAPILDRFPKVAVVIDHVSSVGFDAGPPDYGVDAALTTLASRPNVFFKLTTINLTRTLEAGRATEPVITHLVSVFGAEKLMWGSDIAQTKVAYPHMVAMLKDACAGLKASDRETLFSGAWRSVYGGADTAKAIG